MPLALSSAEHGVDFKVMIRWNLPDQAPQASTLWVMGNNGAGTFRAAYNGELIQDKLAQLDQIRSVEVEFIDPPDNGDPNTGGYFRSPRKGYPAAAKVYAEVVHELQTKGIAAGSWLTHIGISNGSMIGVTALAHHQLGGSVKRYILLGGPFAAHLGPECTDPTFYAFMGNITAGPNMRQLQDLWNGWSAGKYCESGLATAMPSYDSRSLLGGSSTSSYPDVALTVLIGDADDFGPWILASNDNWYNLVSAGSMRRYVLAGVKHLPLGQTGVPLTPSIQRAIDTVYEHAKRPPLQEPDAKATLIFSKTKDGPVVSNFAPTDTLHGRVLGVGPKAQACMESPTDRGLCTQLKNWTTMPNADWSYDTSSQPPVWRCAIPLLIYPPGTYFGWWRDSETEQHTERAKLVVQ